MIELRYRYRIFVIHARKYVRLARLTFAGWLIKLAFWIEPYLENELSQKFTPSERARKAGKRYAKASYNQPVPKYGDVMSRRDFACAVATGGFNDDDGFGYPARNINGTLRMLNQTIIPSRADEIPVDADFVVWFNR